MTQMRNHSTAIGTGQLRLFVASLWLTLATALFCALVPAGLPQTVRYGSAFNPANSAVALPVTSTNRAVLKRTAEGDPATPAADMVSPSDPRAFSLPAPIASLTPVPAPAALILSDTPKTRFPRGPPTA